MIINNFYEFIDSDSLEYDMISNTNGWIFVTSNISILLTRIHILHGSTNSKSIENQIVSRYIKFTDKDLYVNFILIDLSLGNVLYDKNIMNEDTVIRGLNDFIKEYYP